MLSVLSPHEQPAFRIRSRVVKGAPRRTFYLQRRTLRGNGRWMWFTTFRSYTRADIEAQRDRAIENWKSLKTRRTTA